MEEKKHIKRNYFSLIGGCIGGLIAIYLLIFYFHDSAFVILNTLILGSIIGCAYGWVTAKIFSEGSSISSDIKKGVTIGGTFGALSA